MSTPQTGLTIFAPKGLLCRAVKKIVFVRPYVHTCVTKLARARIGTTFWNIPQLMLKFGGPKTDPFRSRREDDCVSMVFELFDVTCGGHVWTSLRNSPFGATHALRV